MSTPALHVAHLPLAERRRVDGGFWYVGFGDDIRGMHYICPCGCRKQGFLRFNHPDTAERGWTWDGNRENPVLKETIDLRKSCGWIGTIGKGRWHPK